MRKLSIFRGSGANQVLSRYPRAKPIARTAPAELWEDSPAWRVSQPVIAAIGTHMMTAPMSAAVHTTS